MKRINEIYAYALSAVPEEKRKPANHLAFILIGYAISSSGLTVGAELGNKMIFPEAAGICILGNLFLFVMALFWGILGYDSGYGSIYLIKKYLGTKVSILFSIFLISLMILWMGLNGEILAHTLISAFLGWQLPMAVTVVLMVGLFLLCSLWGWKGMETINRVCVPVILLLTIYNVIRGILNGANLELVIQYQPETGIAFPAALAMVIGNFSMSAITMADICRLAKSRKAVLGCASAYAVTLILSNLIGILIVQSTGTQNLSYGIYRLGIVGTGFLWILLCACTTQVVNVYISSLAIQSLSWRTVFGGNISHKTAVLLVGGMAMITGIVGPYRYLTGFVGAVVLIAIPLTGAVFAKIYKNRKRGIL